jgi:hypothetical protein
MVPLMTPVDTDCGTSGIGMPIGAAPRALSTGTPVPAARSFMPARSAAFLTAVLLWMKPGSVVNMAITLKPSYSLGLNSLVSAHRVLLAWVALVKPTGSAMPEVSGKRPGS